MKILIVDDSPVMRHVIKGELEEGGYEVIEAKNGIDALRIVLTIPIDLITMDIDMPEMNGYDTYKTLQSEKYSHIFRSGKYNKIPIIFITGVDTIERRNRGFDIGVSDFITKPFKQGDILIQVNKILQPENKLKGLVSLVVDDNDVTRGLISSCLIEQGVTVIETKDGKEAFEAIQVKDKKIDMVITDLLMPVMNGDELCRKVRNELKLKELPIIFLTAMSERQSILDVFKAGATDYLIKPFVKEELIARLNVHLESRKLNKDLMGKIEEMKDLAKLRDHFMTIYSHDLASPVNNILGFTDILLDEEHLNQTDKENLNHIKTSAEVLLTMVNDIIDVDHMQSPDEDFKIAPLSLLKVAESSINTQKHIAKSKNIELKLENKIEDNAKILGNASFLARAIDNLLSNAIKFTLQGRTVKIVIEPCQDNQIALSVIDTGMGIPEKNIPLLFERSEEAIQRGDGMGTGLPIVKEIVDKHGGRIEVISKKAQGSCFKVIFPKIPPAKEE